MCHVECCACAVVNTEAGTLAALFYKNVRGAEFPTRNCVVAPQQDVKFTVGEFDVSRAQHSPVVESRRQEGALAMYGWLHTRKLTPTPYLLFAVIPYSFAAEASVCVCLRFSGCPRLAPRR